MLIPYEMKLSDRLVFASQSTRNGAKLNDRLLGKFTVSSAAFQPKFHSLISNPLPSDVEYLVAGDNFRLFGADSNGLVCVFHFQ